MQRRDIEQNNQDEVQPMITFYKKIKHIKTDTVILCTNI